MTSDSQQATYLSTVAEALDIPPHELISVALGFGDWISGRNRFPTLSQQNQEWYRVILAAAGKSNPSREELKAWFGLPHGTAQYLASVFYDPEAERLQEGAKSDIAARAISAIR